MNILVPVFGSFIKELIPDFIPSDISKIFDYQEFGYRKIKVQRPLRYVVNINETTLTQFKASKEFAKFAPEVQSAVENYLVSHFGDYSFSQFLAEMFAKLYTMKTAITAADRLNDKVLPFFESQESPMLRILTDRSSEILWKSGKSRLWALFSD